MGRKDGLRFFNIQSDLMLQGGRRIEFHARADETVQLNGTRLVVKVAVEIE